MLKRIVAWVDRWPIGFILLCALIYLLGPVVFFVLSEVFQ